MNHPDYPSVPKGVFKRSPTTRISHLGKAKYQLHDETPRFGIGLEECPSIGSYESSSVIPDSAASTKRDPIVMDNRNTQPKVIMNNIKKPPKPPRENTINPRN